MPFLLSRLCLRCIPGALLYSPPPHRHPPVLPGAGSGSEDQTWQHRGVELRLPSAGRHRGLESDGMCNHSLNNQLIHHTSPVLQCSIICWFRNTFSFYTRQSRMICQLNELGPPVSISFHFVSEESTILALSIATPMSPRYH